jgi:hypothetical protein
MNEYRNIRILIENEFFRRSTAFFLESEQNLILTTTFKSVKLDKERIE